MTEIENLYRAMSGFKPIYLQDKSKVSIEFEGKIYVLEWIGDI